MLLNPTDEVLKALLIIGTRRPGQTHSNHLDDVVDRLHLADANGVFDEGDCQKMASLFIQEYC